MDRGECHADDRFRRAEFLLYPNHAIARRGRDDGAAKCPRCRVVRAGRLPTGDRGEDTQRHARREPSRDLGRAQNRRVLGAVDKIAARIAARPRADAAGVEVARPVAAQQLAALGEERPLLLEKHLECREIHDRGIGFDLPEVGVHRAVERDVGTEPHLQIGADATAEICAAVERIPRRDTALKARVGRAVGHELESAGRLDALDAHELSHERRPSGAVGRHRDPVVVLARGGIPPVSIEAPHLHRLIREPELRKGDAHLRGPAQRIDVRFRLPDRVEPHVRVVLIVRRMVPVRPHPGCRDPERVRGALVVVAVERHPHAFRLEGIVAA